MRSTVPAHGTATAPVTCETSSAVYVTGQPRGAAGCGRRLGSSARSSSQGNGTGA
jgi:hypothetical protein